MATTARVAEAAKDLLAPFLTNFQGTETRDDWEAYCPVHSDLGSSRNRKIATICFNDGHGNAFWNCRNPDCPSNETDKGWPFNKMVAYLKQRIASGEVVLPAEVIDLKTKKRVAAAPSKPVTEAQMAAAAGRLLNNPKAIEMLMHKRGVNERSIAEIMIGLTEDKSAFTIPVLRPDGTLAGMRLWRHSAKVRNEAKMKWAATGGDHPMLFSEEVREYDEVLILEGEWDAVLARQMGFPATSGTLGSGGWHDDWTALLAGKRVTFMYDPDGSGIKGAEKHAQRLANSATPPKAIRVVQEALPGDFTDLVMVHGWSTSQVRKVLDAVPWEPVLPRTKEARQGERATSLPINGKPVPFDTLTSRDSRDINVESTVLVNARVSQYTVPWQGQVSCGNNQGTKCAGCPLEMGKGEANTIDFSLDRTNRDHMLPMIGVSDKEIIRHIAAAESLHCTKIEVEREKDVDIEKLICSNATLDITQEANNSGKMLTVYQVGSLNTKAGEILRIVGRQHPEPKGQHAVFMSWYKEDNDPLRERLVLDDEQTALLKMFRPGDDQEPLDKLMDVAASLNAQFGIVDRDLLTAAYLLTYMSVLELPFRGADIRGWMQGMVVGDTRTGKTAVAEALQKHIGLGAMIKCDVSSRAGLVGGRTSHDENTYIRMGLLPQNDKRMAFLDEVTNMLAKNDIVQDLTEMRSSGVMSINFVDSAKFLARVRQVWISNPKNGRKVTSHAHAGITAIGELIEAQQDLSRFDWLYAVAINSDTTRAINKVRRSALSPYTSYAMRLLVEWIWTRKSSDIVMSPDVEREVGATAQALAERYDNEQYQVIPGNDAGLKIARMAAAMAAMQFSTENGSEVIVTVDHVAAAGELLDTLLSSEDLGLAEYCAREQRRHISASESAAWLESQIESEDDYYNICLWMDTSRSRTKLRDASHSSGALNAEEVLHQLISRGLVLQNSDLVRLAPEAKALVARMRKDGRVTGDRRNSGGSRE